MDESMAALLAEAAAHPDGVVRLQRLHVSDLPAMTRLMSGGLFEFRECPVGHCRLTTAGWAAAGVEA